MMEYKNIYTKTGSIIRQPFYDGTLADATCKTEFLAVMNAKASALGMSDTIYVSPSGLTTSNHSTPQDAMKLGVAVCGNKVAMDIWHTPSRSFPVFGSNARTINVTNNVISGSATDLTPYYKLLGGKGGSLDYGGDSKYRAQILVVEVKNTPVVLSVMVKKQTNFDNIFKSCKELADMIKDTMEGNTPTEGSNLAQLITDGGGYCGCAIPNIPEAFSFDYSSTAFAGRSGCVKRAEDSDCIPASTTKTMTMLCALDYITDFDTLIEVKTGDIEGGSGTAFANGDILRIGDALRIMMMESSNTLAQAIGRTVGAYLVQRDAA